MHLRHQPVESLEQRVQLPVADVLGCIHGPNLPRATGWIVAPPPRGQHGTDHDSDRVDAHIPRSALAPDTNDWWISSETA